MKTYYPVIITQKKGRMRWCNVRYTYLALLKEIGGIPDLQSGISLVALV